MRPLLLVSLLATLGCTSTSTPAPTEPEAKADAKSTPEPDSAGATALPSDLKATVCSAEDVDDTSTIYLAFDGSGALHRVVVTPSRSIADMGNLVFDTRGTLLGHDTGGEVPWDDEEFMKEENARVEALMDGAKIPRRLRAPALLGLTESGLLLVIGHHDAGVQPFGPRDASTHRHHQHRRVIITTLRTSRVSMHETHAIPS